MKKHWRVLLPVALLCISFVAKAQNIVKENVPVNNVVGKAEMLYQSKNFRGCIALLDEYSLRMPTTEKTDYLLLVCNFELRTGATKRLLQEFRHKYPFTVYTYELTYFEANVAFEEREWKRASVLFANLPTAFLREEWERNYSYRLALSYLLSGDLDNAGRLFKNFPADDPYYHDAVVYYNSYIDYTKGNYSDALNGFLKLTNVDSFKLLASMYVAQIYYLQQDTDNAIEYGKQSLTRFKEKQIVDEMNRIVGECYYLKGDYEQSINYLNNYLNSNSKGMPSAWFAYGASLFNIQSYSQAIAPLSKGVSGDNSQSQTAQYYLGMCYTRQGDTRNAQMAFEAASKMNHDRVVKEYAMYNNALLLYRYSYAGFEGATGVFDRFMEEFPTSPLRESLSEYLVEVYSTTKNYKQAIASIEKIKYPTPAILASKQRLYYQKGVEEVVNSQYKLSLESFTKAIALSQQGNTFHNDSYYWRGEAYYRMGRYGEAASDYSSFIKYTQEKSGNNYAMAHYNLGYAYFKKGNFVAALGAFNKFTSTIVRKDDPIYGDGLNRIGDCYFAQRNFAEAERYFLLSSRLSHSAVDYSIYQQAMMQGYMRRNNEKQRTMDRLLAAYPSSSLADDALFEKARAYVAEDKNMEAVGAFDRLIKSHPESPFAKKALLQMAFAYRNLDNTNDAMEVYKQVIRSYPNSEEALVANSDLKSLAQDGNRVNEYVEFIGSLGGTVKFSASEQDSLVYFAAEKQFLKNDFVGARKSMNAYLQTFPNGAFSVAAVYYLGRIAENEQKNEEANNYYLRVVNEPESKYTEGAAQFVAYYQFARGEYVEAYTRFMQLLGCSHTQEGRVDAMMGMLRSAFAAKRYSEALQVVSRLDEQVSLLPEQVKEKRLITAKIYLIQDNVIKAEEGFNELAKDTRDRFGAEAKFLVAEIYFMRKELSKSEEVILSYIEQGTTHQYWLARTFILYSDVLMAQNKEFEAKQYLMSLKNSYTVKDDIQPMITSRLGKMK